MTNEFRQTDFGIDRRTVLRTMAGASAMGIIGMPSFMSGQVSAATSETYVLSQGGTEYTIEPVTYSDQNGTGLMPIADFYNYASAANPGGSNTPLNIEGTNQSRMFLYRDDTGLYVVFLHDNYDSSQPSDVKDWQAYFDFSGLPTTGSWVIDEGNDNGDDFGDGTSFYWRWFPRYSDGSAYGLLSCEPVEEFSITVIPDFNPNPDGTTFPGVPQSEDWLDTDGWKLYNGDGSLIQLDESAQLTIACEACVTCPFEDSYKFEYIYGEETDQDGFILEEDDGFTAISFDSYLSKESEEYEPVTVYFDSNICADSLTATVKAGRIVEEVDVVENEDGMLTVTIDYDNSPFVNKKNNKLYAISYIEFACVEVE